MQVHPIFQRIFEAFGLTPRKEPRRCPECGSEEYGWREPVGQIPGGWQCDDCGHVEA